MQLWYCGGLFLVELKAKNIAIGKKGGAAGVAVL